MRFLTLLFSLCTVPLTAQTIRGTVTDTDGTPLEFANVLLFQLPDSAMVFAELTDLDGNFAFRKVAAGTYYLDVNSLGYADFYSQPFTTDGETDWTRDVRLGTTSNQLEEFPLTARKPFLEQRAGKLTVNVENSIAGANGSVQDLLKRVPGLVVVNNQLQMAGKPSVTIFIDGKPTQYLDVQSLLRDMPADNIARIEVISQPDASYEAAGTGGIINIAHPEGKPFGCGVEQRLV